MLTNSAAANPFTLSTTKTTTGAMAVKTPVSFRSLMGGSKGSLLDVYGTGEYLFDRWNISLQQQRGADKGVLIEYGVNLTDLRQEENIASLVTGVAPFWQNEDTLVTLPEKTIQIAADYSFPRIQTLDLSSEFETAPTAAQLRTAAQNYLNSTDLSTPKVSLTVSFVDLSKTDEYKDFLAAVSTVMLCDTVTVRFAKLGVDTKAKVIRTEFDVLKDRYAVIELGEPKGSFTQAQYELSKEIAEKPSLDFVLNEMLALTNAITGNTGGYIVLRPSKNAQELLIMDTNDVQTAQNVWRWNLAGLAHSSSGINGPYTVGITADGRIVADFITTGTLSANLIRAGVLSSIDGKTTFNLATGKISATDANASYVLYPAGGFLVAKEGEASATNYDGGLYISTADGLVLKSDSINSNAILSEGYYLKKSDGTNETFANINAAGISNISGDFFSRIRSDNSIDFIISSDSATDDILIQCESLLLSKLNGLNVSWKQITINGTSYVLLAQT